MLLMGFNSPKLFYSLDSWQTEIELLSHFLFNSIKMELYFFLNEILATLSKVSESKQTSKSFPKHFHLLSFPAVLEMCFVLILNQVSQQSIR